MAVCRCSFLFSVLALVLLPFADTAGQHLPGAAASNYAGTQALYQNPAFVTDTRYSFHLNLAGVSLYEANNHVGYNAPYSFLSLLTNSVPAKYRDEKGAILLPGSQLVEKLNGRSKHLNFGAEVRLPSLMVSLLDGRLGIGAGLRVRTLANLTRTTQPIARALSNRGKNPDMLNQRYDNQAATLHLNGVGELALTVGGVLLDNDTDFFKIGITVKRLVGLYNAHILINDGSFVIRPDPEYANEKEIVELPAISTTYGYTADEAIQNFSPSPGWLAGSQSAGSGWGFDLGLVYEYRPTINKFAYQQKGVRKLDASKNKYRYRLSVALTDLGRVRFNNPAYVRQYSVTTTDRALRLGGFQNLDGTAGFFQAVNTALGTDTTARATSFRSVLPAALQTSVDYALKRNVYLNVLWVQNLIPAGAFGMKGESILAFTPRYEHRWYELSLPVSLTNRYRSPAIGLAGRAGPLWFGTDHLAGLLNIGRPKVFTLYAGLSAGLYRRPPKSPNACFRPAGSTFWDRLFRRE